VHVHGLLASDSALEVDALVHQREPPLVARGPPPCGEGPDDLKQAILMQACMHAMRTMKDARMRTYVFTRMIRVNGQ